MEIGDLDGPDWGSMLDIRAAAMDNFVNSMVRDAKSAMRKTDESELTDGERFALCWASGCEMVFTDRADAYHARTKNDCGFVRDGEKWIVFERRSGELHEHRLTGK